MPDESTFTPLRWTYVGSREGNGSTDKAPKSFYGFLPEGGTYPKNVCYFSRHGAKGTLSPGVGQVFLMETARLDDSNYTLRLDSRQFADLDHDLSAEDLQAAQAADLAWTKHLAALKIAKSSTRDEALEDALDTLAAYYWGAGQRTRRAAVLGYFIQRITGASSRPKN